MTSKEFKEKIENSPTIFNRHMLLVDDKVLSIIKDLEVLEILKNNLYVNTEYTEENDYEISIYELMSEEKEKIKQWLDRN